MSLHSPKKEPLIGVETSPAYKSALKTVAEQWNDTAPDYSAARGAIGHFVAMRAVVTERSIVAQPTIERVMQSIPNQAGMEVVGRFFYIGAAKAALQGATLTELSSALYQPASFNQIVAFMREHNTSARRMEHSLGLTDPSYPNLKEFHLDERGLVIPKFALHRYMTRTDLLYEDRLTREEAYTEDPDTDPIRCVGLTTGLVPYMYKYMLDISTKDPALFPAQLSPDQPQKTDESKT